MAEKLGANTLVIHFEKGNPDYKGVYQAINQMFLEHFGNPDILVNREQDLGDAGLRKAKLSYHPVDYLKKFCCGVLKFITGRKKETMTSVITLLTKPTQLHSNVNCLCCKKYLLKGNI